MKNIFLYLILLIGFSAFAQKDSESSDHLSFKGVPINGTLDEYVSKMKESGFTFEGQDNGIAMLSGDFAGFKECTIGVVTYNQKDLVSKIAVVFPENDTWSTLSGNYNRLKELLTEKYGKPSKVVEEFQTYSQPRTDNSKLHHVKMDEYTYYTNYETDKGTIQVSIEHEGVSSCYVMLSYFDKINSSIVRENAIDDL